MLLPRFMRHVIIYTAQPWRQAAASASSRANTGRLFMLHGDWCAQTLQRKSDEVMTTSLCRVSGKYRRICMRGKPEAKQVVQRIATATYKENMKKKNAKRMSAERQIST